MNKGGSSGIYDRCLEKTPEHLFVGVLRRKFELSPAASLADPVNSPRRYFAETPLPNQQESSLFQRTYSHII